MDWLDPSEPKTWAGSILAALIGWLARRRGGAIWRSLNDIRSANERLGTCEAERDYLQRALREMVAAAELVHEARMRGWVTTSQSSSPAPASSPDSSSPSPDRPPSRPATR